MKRQAHRSEWHRLRISSVLSLTHSLALAGYKLSFAVQQPITATVKVMSECGFSPENPQTSTLFQDTGSVE